MFPLVDRAGEDGLATVDDLAGAVVDELESGDGEPAGGFDDGVFGPGGFVTYVVGNYPRVVGDDPGGGGDDSRVVGDDPRGRLGVAMTGQAGYKNKKKEGALHMVHINPY